jgi:ubiquinone biosynthesis monooxygenase Coq7
MSVFDPFISLLDQSLRTIFAPHHAARPDPALGLGTLALSDTERAESGALMRVNHVGEVCAQALYAAQALATRNPHLRDQFVHASAEETDHLAWTEARLHDLGARPSLLNPLWYSGAFGLGFIAGKLGGDAVSLGFVVETERQVEAHLQSHLDSLPQADLASRAVVAQMKVDEAQHAVDAEKAGAAPLPRPIPDIMRMAAKVMTTVAHRI